MLAEKEEEKEEEEEDDERKEQEKEREEEAEREEEGRRRRRRKSRMRRRRRRRSRGRRCRRFTEHCMGTRRLQGRPEILRLDQFSNAANIDDVPCSSVEWQRNAGIAQYASA